MNKFKKYYPNVFIAECEDKYSKGDCIELTTKYGKDVECKVYNFIKEGSDGKFYYSIVRMEDENYAERKAAKYNKSADLHSNKSNDYFEKSKEGRDFLVLAEPIKIGHHSEGRHRALIERNNNRMRNCIAEDKIAKEKENKAAYWENKAIEINLSMPISLEYFTKELEEAREYHQGLKSGKYIKEHSYSMAYANKKVKELTKKVAIAQLLWGLEK